MKTLILIPAYNEEKNIERMVLRVLKFGRGKWDVLVVDDGSRDKTFLLAKMTGAIVVKHPFNMGYGVAIQTGYKYAVENGYDYLVQIDADGQHDPKYIREMVDYLEDGTVDVIVGSRFKKNTGYQAPLMRKIGMMFFGKVASLIVGKKITDSTSGYQGFNKRVLLFLVSDVFPCDYPDADLLIMLHYAGFRVEELSMVMYENNTGKSMHGSLVKNIYYVLKMSLSIFTILLRRVTNLKSF